MAALRDRLTAATLAVLLSLTCSPAAALAAPAVPPSAAERPSVQLPPRAHRESLRFSPAVIPGAADLPPSGFSASVAGTPPQEPTMSSTVFAFTLDEGEVLKATINSEAASQPPFLVAAGFPSHADTTDELKECTSLADGFPWRDGFDVYIPAENGQDLYYLAVFNTAEDPVDFTVTYERLAGRSGAVPERVDGVDRYAVAERVGLEAFPGWAGVTDVVIASGEDRAMADPLAAGGLAGALDAPILLVRQRLVNGKLPPQTERALAKIRAANGGKVNVHVIGGTTTVPATVYKRIAALRGTGGTIERIDGIDRYALSASMARRTRDIVVARGGTVDVVLVANGENPAVFYDALAASAIAYRNEYPTVLSRAKAAPSSVRSLLGSEAFADTTRILVNAPQHLDATVRAQTGAVGNIVLPASGAPYNRYLAAWDIADFAYFNRLLDRDTVAVANKLPDALTGGVAMGQLGAPILYTNVASQGVPDETAVFLYLNKGSVEDAYVLGGTSSVSAFGFDSIAFMLFWE